MKANTIIFRYNKTPHHIWSMLGKRKGVKFDTQEWQHCFLLEVRCPEAIVSKQLSDLNSHLDFSKFLPMHSTFSLSSRRAKQMLKARSVEAPLPHFLLQPRGCTARQYRNRSGLIQRLRRPNSYYSMGQKGPLGSCIIFFEHQKYDYITKRGN